MSPGVNRGIIEAVAAGAVTSVSLMVGMPAADEAIQAARAVGDNLGVGLHLTLTAGRPLTRAGTLTDETTGDFLSLPRLMRRALSGRVRGEDVVAECRAQIARARHAGLTLTHLDGHQHVHVLPGVADAVRRAVVAERIPAIRRPLEPLFRGTPLPRRLPQRLAINAFTTRARLHRWPARTTDHFVGSRLMGAADFAARLIAVLDQLPAGTTELMVHPGHARAPLPGADPYVAHREVELRALLSPAVIARLRSGRIRLITFRHLSER
jgi:predicted glycoside hydrolase/deacetylase ChbG (UPF0249 family)